MPVHFENREKYDGSKIWASVRTIPAHFLPADFENGRFWKRNSNRHILKTTSAGIVWTLAQISPNRHIFHRFQNVPGHLVNCAGASCLSLPFWKQMLPRHKKDWVHYLGIFSFWISFELYRLVTQTCRLRRRFQFFSPSGIVQKSPEEDNKDLANTRRN